MHKKKEAIFDNNFLFGKVIRLGLEPRTHSLKGSCSTN